MSNIRIGFGPATSSNSFHQSGIKVASELMKDNRFTCDFFHWEPFHYEELAKFDILIFIKYVPETNMLFSLKRHGVKMVLDYQDTFLYPSVYESNLVRRLAKKIYYWRSERKKKTAFSLLDGCLYASPLLKEVLVRAGLRPLYLPRQIYNDENEYSFKSPSLRNEGLTLYWTGVGLNQVQNLPLLPVLEQFHRKYGCRVVYDSDMKGDVPWIEYRKFDRLSWPNKILDADIAFRWRDNSNMQRFKDANKVLSYMAAGLPTIVFPTESEKVLVREGETGFFAYSIEDFSLKMERLILDFEMRSRIGYIAHAFVWKNFSLRSHVDLLKNHLLSLVQ
jgi:glycosyltransferase involved in cell wall biosynthesis